MRCIRVYDRNTVSGVPGFGVPGLTVPGTVSSANSPPTPKGSPSSIPQNKEYRLLDLLNAILGQYE